MSPLPTIRLSSRPDFVVTVMPLGAAITSIAVPDRDGRLADVVLGFDDLESYATHRGCLGVVVGRVANRTSGAAFTLDGRRYALAAAANGLHIHGGPKGFDKRTWTIAEVTPASVRFEYVSADGEEGYPGTCRVAVTYAVTAAAALVVDYAATTDAATPINLSQHVYFNLAGHGAGDVLGHRVQLHAGRFTPMNAAMCPTGEIRPVDGTPLDFRRMTAIGARIGADDEQLRIGKGYDHNFVIDRHGPGLVTAARVVEPRSGRSLEVATTEPGVQFYTGNSLDGTLRGKGGAVYGPRAGFCLETQHFPDSANIPSFPPIILRPGETFASRTVFAFGIESR